jgi:hypothetical protein
MAMKWSDVAASSAFQALSFDEQEEARNQYFNEVVAPRVSEDEVEAVRGQFLADTQQTLAPVPDTGDETARLAARYKAPEKPGLIQRAASAISSVLPKPVDPLGIGSGRPLGASRAQEPAKPPKAPTPYRDRREALDDAVNLLEEGADQKAVTEAFSQGGIKFDEIVAHGKKRGSEYFEQQPGMGVVDPEVARLANRYPAPVTGEIKSTRPETPLPGADVLLAGAKGVVGGFKMLMSAGGAGGRPTSTAEKALETADLYLEGLRSAAAVKDDERIGQIMEEAKDGTWADQVVAAAKAAGVAPASLVAQGLGTSVPVILATLLPGVRESTVARLTAQIGLGAAQGAGATKESIYSAVKEDMLRAGVSKIEAEERAEAAQSYLGQNKDQIAIGMALGALASSTGVERVIPIGQVSKVLAKSGVSRAVASAEQNVIGRGLIGGVTEAVPEFAQGSAEQVAQNVALQREGRDVPTFQGAVGQGTLEAIAGFGAGAVTNAAFGRPQTAADQLARELDVSIANTDFTSADPVARARLDPNTYDSSLVRPEQTARSVADVGPSAPISFTPVGAPTQEAGLVDIVVPTAPETTDVSTLGATGGQLDLRSPAGSDQLGGGLGLPGLDVDGTRVLRSGDAGLPAADAGANVPAGSAAGQPTPGIALPRVAARATDQELLARTEAAIAAPENNNAVVEPTEQWFGRKGDGYATEVDAGQALAGRKRMFPTLDWKVEEMPSGKFRLAGYEQQNTQPAPTVGTMEAGAGTPQPTQAAPITAAAPQAVEPITAPSGAPFSTAQTATVFARQNGITDFTTQPVDGGFVIQPAAVTAPEVEATPAAPVALTPAAAEPITAPSGKPFSTQQTAAVFAQQNGITGYSTVKMDGGWAIKPMETTLGTQTPQAIQGQTQGQQAPAIAGAASPGMGQPLASGSAAQAQGGGDIGVSPVATGPVNGRQQPGALATPEGASTAGLKTSLRLAPPAPASAIGKAITTLSASTGVDAEVDTTPLTERQQAASAVARLLGRTVTYLKADTPASLPNGFMLPGDSKNIFVANDADDAPLSVAMHEIYHTLPEPQRKALNTQLAQYFRQDRRAEFATEFQYDAKNDALLDEEIPAFMVQAISKREDFWQDLRTKMGNAEFGEVAKTILAKLNTIISGAKEQYGDEFVSKYITDVAKARDLLSTAYAESMQAQGLTPDVALVSDAQPMASNRAAPQTPEFKKFFGDSKVVSGDGKPLVVYHGTNQDITAFDPRKIGRRDSGFFGSGFYMTANEEEALNYADSAVEDAGEGEAQAMPLYAALQNPFIWDMSDAGAATTRQALAGMGIRRDTVRGNSAALSNTKERETFNRAVREAGYDGVIVRDEDGVLEVVAFRPEQIKSATGNTGTFDSANPNIMQSRRGTTAAGEFDVRTMKDGTMVVYGDPEQIRAQVPEDVKGRVTKDGIVFTNAAAPRVRAALEGRQVAYSRGGEVTEKLPMKNGKYLGAPEKFNTPGKIPTLRKILRQLADEGAPGRYWYENSGKEVLKMVGGDVNEARKFVALLAIYSPQAKVDANSTFALRAWAQYKAGQPISVKTEVMDTKAKGALDDVDAFWSGEKTGNFFFNLLREIDPSTAGKQGATIDMWMMRAGQYSNDAPTGTQYSFMENETNRLAQELGWEPQQVQAAIWVAMKARMENKGVKKETERTSEKKGWIKFVPGKDGKGKVRVILDEQKHRDNWLKYSFEHDVTKDDTQQAKFDFGDGLKRHIGQVSFEARPGRITGILPGIHSAPYAQQMEFQQAVQAAFLDENGADTLAQMLGLLIDTSDMLAPNVWRGEVSPSTQKLIAMAPAKGDAGKTSVDPAQAKALNVYAAVAGLVARQDGVGWHRPFYSSTKRDANGLDINLGRVVNPAEMADVQRAVAAWMNDNNASDYQDKFGIIASPSGIRLVNFGIITNEKLQTDILKVAESVLPDFDYRVFASSGEIATNNWKESPNGESYVQRVGAEGRSDVLDWARAVLAPRVQQVFDEYSKQYGWGDAGTIRFSNRAGDGSRGQGAGSAQDRQVQAPERADAQTVQGLSANDALPGAPTVRGFTGPDPRLVAVAEQYARDNGIELRRQAEYAQVDPERAARIAEAYEAMPHAPQDLRVKAAYKELIAQTVAQYRALEKAGYKFWFIDSNKPDNQEYASSPWNAMRDIRANKVMGVFPTDDGFGSGDFDPASNPLLEDTGIKWPSGSLFGPRKRVLANDLFRAVHDAFGHGLEGSGFRAQGEENAWQAHVRLFTGSAVAAITTETRGQNSWLNYGPNGESNRNAKVEDTVFADQKTGLLPEFAWTEGRVGDMGDVADAEPSFSNRVLEDRIGVSQLPYQGYVKAEVPRVQAARKMAGILAKLDAGTITPQEFELQVRLLSERLAEVSATKDANRIVSERARGADIVREKLIAARRRGEVDSDTTEFALWALQQNPAIAEGLGISVREQPENQRGAAGDYNPAAAIMRVFKGYANTGTAVHEILHHTERMMPEAVQTGIRKEWSKAYVKALGKADPKQRAALEKMLEAMAGSQAAQTAVREAFSDGTLKYDAHYQLLNPSEFWAVNATDILQRRYEAGSWIGKAKQWLSEMVQTAKGLVGMRSNAPVLRGLEAVLNTDGERQSKKMLSEGKVFEDIAAPDTPAFRKFSGGAQVIELGDFHEFRSGEPVVVEALHGTTNADLTEFKRSRANVESDMGAGFYASNTPEDVAANYANVDGPDLTQRVEMLAERLAQDDEFEDDMDAAREEARKRLSEGAPNTMKLYMRFKNPAVIGNNETFLDYSEEYNEETDEYEEPTGKLVDFVEALREVAPDFNVSDREVETAIGKIFEQAEGEGLKVSDAHNIIKRELMDASDEDGNSASNEVFRQALSRAGFDGVIDATVYNKFGPKMRRNGEVYDRAGGMKGMNEGTVHFIAFEPTQIKSATGNDGNFDATNPDIRASNRRQKLSTIGQNFTLPGTSMVDAGRIKLQDDALRMRRVIEAVKAKGGKVGEAQNFYDANTLMPGRVQATMDDFRDNVMRPLIDKAVGFGIDMDELALYAYAKHAEERNAYIASINKRMPDGGSGMTDAHAKSILQLAKASGDEAKFEELHRDLMAITSTTRQVMLAEGLISQDEFNALDGSYENYIPLRGLENVDENTGAMRPGVGRGINVRGGETIKALGRKSQAGDLIENVIRDYQRVIMRVEKNDVGKVLLDFVLSNPDPDLWGVDVERSKPSLNKATGLVQYTKNIEKGEDTIGVKVGGEQVYIKLADPELARAIRQAWKDETSGLERATLAVSGWWNNWLRNVLTRYNPAFAAINIPRDALWSGTSAALAELGPKGLVRYLANYGKAFMASSRQEAGLSGSANKFIGNQSVDQVFQEFRSAGAITGGFYMRSLEDINTDLRNEMLLAGAKAKNTFEVIKSLPPYKMATMTARMLEFMGSASENATRFALYQAAKDVGRTPAQAALLAKDGTTNFNRKGEYGGALNNLYLFFNAAVQGNRQLFKVLKSPAVQASMAGVTGVGMMLALYGASTGGEDDDGEAYWDKVPSYVKERNLVFMLPPGDALADGIDRVGKRGRYFTLPVQYGFNFFPNTGYMMADVLRNSQDPKRGVTPTKAALHMTSVFFGSMNPLGGAIDFDDKNSIWLAVLPTIADLPYQISEGVNSFGRPSAPERSPFDVRPDSSRMFTSQMNTVSEKLAKALNELGGGNEAKAGKILGVETSVTPGTIQTLISGTTGGLGSFVEQVGSSVVAMTGDEKDVKASKIPFLNKFYGEVDEDANIRGAGDRMREIKKLSDQVKAQQKVGLDPELDKDEKRLISLANMQDAYQKQQTLMRKAEVAIIKDDKMTEAEKTLQRRQIKVERDRLATEVNREYLNSLKEPK